MIKLMQLDEESQKLHNTIHDYLSKSLFAMVGYLESLERRSEVPKIIKVRAALELIEEIEEIASDCRAVYGKM